MSSDLLHSVEDIQRALREYARPDAAETAAWFFKAGPGEYGEGDQFLGVKVPNTRKVAKRARNVPWDAVPELLESPWHEERLCGLVMWTYRFPKADPPEQEAIVRSYLTMTHRINNWDLVDSSAHKILGPWLIANPEHEGILDKLAVSEMLWERRIAIISTFAFFKEERFEPSMRMAETLVHDEHDLIHKAVGWTLREVGKRAFDLEVAFLDRHYENMPRTMLRYAIEKFPEPLRQDYLKGNR